MARPQARDYSGVFIPAPSHRPVGQLESSRGRRVESDSHLYFDQDSGQFFTVHSTEHESGPRLNAHHTIAHLTPEDVDNLAALHPDLRPQIHAFRSE